ncbi:MAG: hypothetical protein N2651_04355 [Fimbriimonadales bacterium]|nr:hypothetical protein [Fimbriimonadales bacterium]
MCCAMILCAVVLALTGCAKQEQESTAAAPPPDSGTALQPTEPPLPAPKAEPKPAPESQKPTETTQAPDDFPLPIYEGFTVKNTLRTQTGDFKGMQVEIAGNATPETVAQFYEAEFNKRGLKVSKMTQKTDAGDEVLVLGQSDKITAGIAAAKEQDQTRVILSWSEKK